MKKDATNLYLCRIPLQGLYGGMDLVSIGSLSNLTISETGGSMTINISSEASMDLEIVAIDGNFSDYQYTLCNENRNGPVHQSTCTYTYSYNFEDTGFYETDIGYIKDDQTAPWDAQYHIDCSDIGQANGHTNLTPFVNEVFSDTREGNETDKELNEKKRSATARKPSDSAVPAFIRLGATVRERSRMHVLNEAFDELRKVIPRANLCEHQKLSKIATLRQAIQYIGALVRMLESTGVEIRKFDGYCVGDMRGKRRTCRKRSV